MPDPPVLDTNVLLRHLLDDHPDPSPRATALIDQIEAGKRKVRATETVGFETVFVLERTLGRKKALIRDGVLSVVELPGIVLPGERRLRRTFDLYVESNIPFADAFHAAVAEDGDPAQIVSFDQHSDRITGLVRLEP